MICPQCGKDTFVRLDYESVDDAGQCEGPGGCKYRASTAYVSGFNKAMETALHWKQQYLRIEQKYVSIVFPAATELGFDLRQLVHDNPGKNCVELFIDKFKDFKTNCVDLQPCSTELLKTETKDPVFEFIKSLEKKYGFVFHISTMKQGKYRVFVRVTGCENKFDSFHKTLGTATDKDMVTAIKKASLKAINRVKLIQEEER